MELKQLKPRKALNKAYLKVKPNRADIEKFKQNLVQLLDHANDHETEEFHKNLVSDFLKNTYYAPHYFINTKGRNDLVIHNGSHADSTVGVIIEAKKPGNKAEMVTRDKLNVKAFQELVLYYLRERITHKNLEIKHLVVTNLYEWFIFDATVFEKLFAQNKVFVKQFQDFESKTLVNSDTSFFYKQIAEPYIAGLTQTIEFTYFDIKDYQKPLQNTDKTDDTKLIALFKLLSGEHLLKLPFANDSNTLDKRFYSELLHIIGLTETKEGGKKLIGLNKAGERNTGSLLENAIIQLDTLDKIDQLEKPAQFGSTHQERLFNVGLELAITWVNRILFLKLLEAQLITYHKGDRSYAFLSLDKIQSYDDLNSLFFQVLARRPDERNDDVRTLFAKVPYLNSSLFEPTTIEHATLFISNLKDDKAIPVLGTTVLKNGSSKLTGHLSTLEYLFRFLDAYDFSSEGSEDIQEDNKTLINASVLGLIFEKINGYKDGSFFTPGFITMYMCRETIRRAVVQKFNETKTWNCQTIDELYDRIDDRAEANTIVNSIKICDPAVGSGHFLVSALNEMIAVKNDLKILQDRSGKRLKEYQVEVVNDELIVTDDDGELFEYNPNNPESQRIQQTLFHEKQTIIENCLFGVDINPNSVKICRLRLWIELLKNAYYKNPTELETLPNIDINIKCGNSLVSRFAIDADLNKALKKSGQTIESYRNAVDTYRNAQSKEQKREMERLIERIKNDFETTIETPFKSKLAKARGEANLLLTDINTKKQWGEKIPKDLKTRLEKAEKKLALLEAERDTIQNNAVYANAFEWRFEFPEVLNNNGDFIGFDVVIGNPPYIRQEEFSDLKPYLKKEFATFAGTADLYVYFVEQGIKLLQNSGQFSYIIPNKWMRAGYGQGLRAWLQNYSLQKLLDFGDLPVFEEATTYPLIVSVANYKSEPNYSFTAATIATLNFEHDLAAYVQQQGFDVQAQLLPDSGWSLSNSIEQQLLEKLKNTGIPLREYVNGKIYRGVLTGLNEAFVIDEATKERLILEDPRSAEIIKPYLSGKDIKRYTTPEATEYIIFLPKSITKENVGEVTEEQGWDWLQENYTSVASFMAPHSKKAQKRTDKGDYWWELRACGYYDELEKPKIIWPETSLPNHFIFDNQSKYINKTCFTIPTNDLTLFAILNSKLSLFYLEQICSKMRGGYLMLSKQHVSQLPIATADEETKATITSLVEQILTIKQENPAADTTTIEAEIDAMVYQLYNLTPDEIKLIDPAFVPTEATAIVAGSVN